MLAAGVDIVVVSKRLGHSSVAITSDTAPICCPVWAVRPLPGRGPRAA